MLLLQARMRTFIFVDGDYEIVMIKTSIFEEVFEEVFEDDCLPVLCFSTSVAQLPHKTVPMTCQ